MNIEEFRNYCLSKKGVEESFPFDENVLTFKLMGKIFALCPINSSPLSINLKCDPERAVLLREEYEEMFGETRAPHGKLKGKKESGQRCVD